MSRWCGSLPRSRVGRRGTIERSRTLNLRHCGCNAPRVMQQQSLDSSQDMSLEAITRIHVLKVLEACAGVRTTAAQALGIDRKTLYRMLKRWQVTE
jgi:transcriptional regulator of acetoin/glycerol metabolism